MSYEKLKIQELGNLVIGPKSKKLFHGDYLPLINEKLILKFVKKNYIVRTISSVVFSIIIFCAIIFYFIMLDNFDSAVAILLIVSLGWLICRLVYLIGNISELNNYPRIATYALKKNKVKIRKLRVTSTYSYYQDMGESGQNFYYVVLGSGGSKCQAKISKNLYSRIYDGDSFYVISLSSPHGFINLLFFAMDYRIQEEFAQRCNFVENTDTSNYKQDNSDLYREEIQQYSNYLKADFKKYIYILSFIAVLIFLAYLIYG